MATATARSPHVLLDHVGCTPSSATFACCCRPPPRPRHRRSSRHRGEPGGNHPGRAHSASAIRSAAHATDRQPPLRACARPPSRRLVRMSAPRRRPRPRACVEPRRVGRPRRQVQLDLTSPRQIVALTAAPGPPRRVERPQPLLACDSVGPMSRTSRRTTCSPVTRVSSLGLTSCRNIGSSSRGGREEHHDLVVHVQPLARAVPTTFFSTPAPE